MRANGVDASVCAKNCRFPKFLDMKTDAFTKNWGEESLLWMNPPFETLEEVVGKIIVDKATAIVIVPEWPKRRWWQKLQKIKVDDYKFAQKEKIF